MFPDQLQVTIAHGDGPVRIVQLTDCHLEQRAGGKLLGMDTDTSLEHVLQMVRSGPEPHLVLATGDLANHGSVAAYRRFYELMQGLSAPVFWLAGNHDDQRAMERIANDGKPLIRRLLVGPWQILLLDSTVPGEVGGELGDAELDLLRACLQEGPRPTLICLHHHPVPIGCAWLDEQMVSDAEQFLQILDGCDHVRALLWGHVHQELDRMHKELRLLCTPSTCIQFAPNSEGFAVDEVAPGYRWLELHPDGRIDTGVRRVEGVDFEFDRQSTGYL